MLGAVASIDYAAKKIQCKLVYWGPSLGGKWTNLDHVYRATAPAGQPTGTKERSLGMPLRLGDIRGFATTFSVLRVPNDGALTKYVLDDIDGRPVDGIVFVADSTPAAFESNRTSLFALIGELHARTFDLAKLPCVFQYNKRDIDGATPVPALETLLNPYGHPHIEAIANRGIGVFDSLKLLAKLVLMDLRKP